ncbi:MAG: S9 family peptidase [Legionellales bacterium]|jgi:oligopeptidase B
MTPPKAKQLPYKTPDGRTDLYHWLRDKDNPEVMAYLKAENEYTKTTLESTDALQERIFQEIRGRMKETDTGAPWQDGDYDYYFRTVQELQYPIFCRKKIGQDVEEILLDENIEAKAHNYFHLNALVLSIDQNLLAYTVDTAGDEYYTLLIKDLRTQTLLTDTIKGMGGDIVFAADNLHFWYTRLDDAHRPFQVWQHKIGTPNEQDTLVFHEKDERFFLSISRTKDDAYLMVNVHSKISSEIHYTDAHTLTMPLLCLYPRAPHIEYDIEHHQGDFIIHTNENAENFQLVRVPVLNPSKENWQVVLAHNSLVAIDSFEIMKDFIVVLERREGLSALHVLSFDNKADYLIEVDEPTYHLSLGHNCLLDSNILRFEYESLKTPHSVFDYNLNNKTQTLIKKNPVLGDFNEDDYVSERVFATAIDGVKIPISLVYKKGLKKPAPLFLNSYGAYGITSDPWFSNARISLLNRGFAFAVAHIRGGGEFGKPWHDQGRFFKKHNTFDDFIAASEYLIAQNYTSAKQLVINGGSAGGLLMGAVVNKRPDLFGVCIANVPFVDVLNTMQDPTLPLSITEYDEWGDPNKSEVHDYIASYSPYDNISRQAYPAILVTAGLTDWRVPFWEAAKWVAKLREYKTDDQLLLLKTDLEAGHYGLSGRYNMIREVALEYAFIFRVLDI